METPRAKKLPSISLYLSLITHNKYHKIIRHSDKIKPAQPKSHKKVLKKAFSKTLFWTFSFFPQFSLGFGNGGAKEPLDLGGARIRAPAIVRARRRSAAAAASSEILGFSVVDWPSLCRALENAAAAVS